MLRFRALSGSSSRLPAVVLKRKKDMNFRDTVVSLLLDNSARCVGGDTVPSDLRRHTPRTLELAA